LQHKFRTTIGGEGASAAAGADPSLLVPPTIVESFRRGKRPPVIVTINGHGWRSTVAVYGGLYYLGVSRANRSAARVEIGDEVEVSLELDGSPREVELPPLLAEALAADPAARAAFESLSFSNRREHAEAVASAKQEETRTRRLDRVLASLREGR
jgi:hypothetical protein